MSNAKQLPHNTEEWKGYTLEEIRYARAYTAARMELNRERLTARARDMQKNGLKLGAFSYIDIALLTWRVGRKLFRVTRAI